MHTQRRLSADILARGGDYLWIAKKNQLTLMKEIAQFFKPARIASDWHIPTPQYDVAQTVDKGHGRLEVRRITVVEDKEAYLHLPGVRQHFMLEREVNILKEGKDRSAVD